ncbi:MAG: TerB N-terminal domain-containing protein [Pirellulales bacterium]|nr:TerB N-terminal domain-containing protein [Pirellulales bacterium]
MTASYHDCSPAQRFRYLDWLYVGRRDPNVEIGYVFIFFYGLERQILVDGQDHETVIQELLRLLSIYRSSRSFTKYANSLLWLTVFLSIHRSGVSESLVLRAIQQTPWWDDDWFRCCLGYFAQRNLALPVEVAYAIAEHDERSPSSVVASRHAEQFRSLFAARFQKLFPNGLSLGTSKRELAINYQAGSPTLLGIRNTLPELAAQTIPDLTSSRAQFSPLVQIWAECIEDLRGFDRASRQADGGAITAEMYESLPVELRTEDHPEHTEQLMREASPRSTLCSSTLELGIDIGNVKATGQIGAPWSVNSLIQRLGRSGRRDGDSTWSNYW